MRNLIVLLSFAFIVLIPISAKSQTANWDRVQQLSALTKVHISADHGGRTCKIFAVTDDTLTCTGHGNTEPGKVFQRADIKSIKRTRYLVSTLVGLGVGVGVGALIGRATNPPNKDAFIDLSGLAPLVFGTLGGIAGASIGGPTDMLRGPTIYARQ